MTKAKSFKTPAFKKEQRIKLLKKAWKQKSLFIMLFIPMFVYILFAYVPMTKVTWAFTNLGAVAKSKTEFIGLDNFKKLIGTSSFRRAFANTLIISFYSMLFSFPMSLRGAKGDAAIQYLRNNSCT